MRRWFLAVLAASAPLSSCGDDDGGGSALNCFEVEAALAELEQGEEVLNQLRFELVYEEVRSGEREFDPDAVADAIATLRQVEAIDVGEEGTEVFGTAREGLDLIERANELARESLEHDDPLASASGQELAALVEETVRLIEAMSAVGLAADIGGCDVY